MLWRARDKNCQNDIRRTNTQIFKSNLNHTTNRSTPFEYPRSFCNTLKNHNTNADTNISPYSINLSNVDDRLWKRRVRTIPKRLLTHIRLRSIIAHQPSSVRYNVCKCCYIFCACASAQVGAILYQSSWGRRLWARTTGLRGSLGHRQSRKCPRSPSRTIGPIERVVQPPSTPVASLPTVHIPRFEREMSD